MPEFAYEPPFLLGPDTTSYRRLGSEGVSTAVFEGLMTSTARSGTTAHALPLAIGRSRGQRSWETNATSGRRLSLPVTPRTNMASGTTTPREFVVTKLSKLVFNRPAIREARMLMIFSTTSPSTTSTKATPARRQ